MTTKKIKFGIIGLGLMGREFASAAARWCHLPDFNIKPEIIALCDLDEEAFGWYLKNFNSIKQVTNNYQELLENPEIEAVYCAVPHNLHEKMYCDIIQAGKHLMAEKPFGIDLQANRKIMDCMKNNPEVFVRYSSEFPFIPAAQQIGKMIERTEFGKIIEVNCGLLHSSDLNVNKPINWKRMTKTNGEYGCMGDLGMHACNIPLRAGWEILNVRAILSNLVEQRADINGNLLPCDTWDNATLLCEAKDSNCNFPLTIKTQRIGPGHKDTWYIEVIGTDKSARFSTKNPKLLEIMDFKGTGIQSWNGVDMGHETAFKSITGDIFEFGFSDAILQMWASYLYELSYSKPKSKFAACMTPEEAENSHQLFTAALESHHKQSTVSLKEKIKSLTK